MARGSASPHHTGMTTTTRDRIVCECGHEGFIRCRENEQPFSTMREEYALEGFDGGDLDLVVTSANDFPKDLLASLKPKCPECGRIGEVKYAL